MMDFPYVRPGFQRPSLPLAGLPRAGSLPVMGQSVVPNYHQQPSAAAPRTTPTGSLTQGVPDANYDPSAYKFRSSIAAKFARIAVNQEQFSRAFASELSTRIGATLLQSAIAVGNTDNDGVTWLTITGTIQAPRAFTLNDVNQSLANALHQSGNLYSTGSAGNRSIGAPEVLSRLTAHNACAGARAGDPNPYGFIAACTRLEPTIWQGIVPDVAITPATTSPVVAPPAAHPARHAAQPAAPSTPAPAINQVQGQPTVWPYYVAAGAVVIGATWWLTRKH